MKIEVNGKLHEEGKEEGTKTKKKKGETKNNLPLGGGGGDARR